MKRIYVKPDSFGNWQIIRGKLSADKSRNPIGPQEVLSTHKTINKAVDVANRI